MKSKITKNLTYAILAGYISALTPAYSEEKTPNPLDLYQESRIEYILKQDNPYYPNLDKLVKKPKSRKPFYRKWWFLAGVGVIVREGYLIYKKKKEKKKEIPVEEEESPDDRDDDQPVEPLSNITVNFKMCCVKDKLSSDYTKQNKKKYDLRINLSLPFWKW